MEVLGKVLRELMWLKAAVKSPKHTSQWVWNRNGWKEFEINTEKLLLSGSRSVDILFYVAGVRVSQIIFMVSGATRRDAPLTYLNEIPQFKALAI